MAAAAAVVTVAVSGSAYAALVGLPATGQVNNDPPTIQPNQNVNVSDLTAGSLAGAARVPWATFAQTESGGATQIVVRAFKNGAWQTEGFPESLNHNTAQDAEAPSIDFAGTNRTVPWVTWDEAVAEFTPAGVQNIFASRFASGSGQNGGSWVADGQGRNSLGVASLNINTNRQAEDPSVTGGTTVTGNNPSPWITWQEADGVQGGSFTGVKSQITGTPGGDNLTFQIFVSRAVGATGGPPAVCPANTTPAGQNSVGNFCFQQVGLPRVQGPNTGQSDPSLNIDPARDGIQADIAFTGKNDAVPWITWYENSDETPSGVGDGLLNADMVFAARAVADTTTGAGGFHWQVVGIGTAGVSTPGSTGNVLNTSNGGKGQCASAQAAELACSLDAIQINPGGGTNTGALAETQALTDGNGAENPSIAAGTMTAGSATVPWITWDEATTNGGPHSVFLARLDSAGDHYDLLNNAQPLSHSGEDSTRPDITFVGNTPYVSWHETNASDQTLTFTGHFEGPATNPVFHIDTPSGIPTTGQQSGSNDGPGHPFNTTDVRAPIASTCPADPFTSDGTVCPSGSIGSPFFAYTQTTGGANALFAQGFTPGSTSTGSATAITKNSAAVAGSVNTDGVPVRVHVDFGTSTAYGQSTAAQLLAPAAGSATAVSAVLSPLPAGSVIHYRLVAQTDFGTVDGADAHFTTKAATATVSGASLRGVARRHAKLVFTLTAGSSAIHKIVVSLPGGLSFSGKSKALAKGIRVTGDKFTAKGGGGTVTLTLKKAAAKVRVTIEAPALTVSKSLATKVKKKKVRKLVVVVKAVPTSGATTRIPLRLNVS